MSEILAPAGSYDSLRAAVLCGADAVYLGAESFNARGNAQNFSRDELKNAVKFCHERNVKIYLTLNTLVADEEMAEAENLISFCGEIGIDAFIIQDLSLVERVKNLAPEAHLHASTQMAVQTVEGIKFLEKLGFSRVVVPRELTKNEIKYLAENTKAELEVFVHGALCMSVSGQCYMSAFLGSRSGNRGLCAQPCRLPFSADKTGGCNLSLKDNSLVPYLGELEEIGVASFKIEGRMKRPEYVAAAVTSCRNSLLHKKDENIEKSLRAVFSRSGFTDGYYTGRRDRDMFGTRGKEDVTAAKDVLSSLASLYEKEKPRFSVDFRFTMSENEPLRLCAECEGIVAEAVSECVAEKAIKREITQEDVKEQLSKLGGTQFFAGEIQTEIQNGLSVPLSAINKLRREITEKLSEEIFRKNTPENAGKESEKTEIFLPKKQRSSPQKTYLFFRSGAQIPETLSEKFIIVLPLSTDTEVFRKLIEGNRKVCAEMPRGIFTHSEKIREKARELLALGVNRFFCPTIDSAAIAKEIGGKVTASFGSNIFNSYSLDVWKKHFADEAVLSVEMTSSRINRIRGSVSTGIICYGHIPLMLTRNCPVKAFLSCEKCKGNGKLTDRKNMEFPVDCSSGTSEILNSVPLDIFDEISQFENIDFCVLEFTVETKEECEKILERYACRRKGDGKFTRGLYRRGVI